MTVAIRSRAWVTRNLWMDIWDDKFRERYPYKPMTPDGAKRFFFAHETMLLAALKRRFTSSHRIARLLGVSQSSVTRWIRDCRT
jgi:hypothetical protein